MKHNNIDEQLKNDILTIEASKNKYFFIGFILGCLPFLLIILVIKNISNYNLEPLILMLVIMAFITATINAFILKYTTYKRLLEFFYLKYDVDYLQIKNSL